MADLAELGFKVDTGGLKNATRDLDKMSSASGRAEKSTFGLANAKRDLKRAALASTAAIIGVAAAVAKLTSNGMASVDAQAKLARSLQGTADGLRAVQLAASEAGVEGMDQSLARLNRRLGAAQMGVGDFAKTTEALGLNLRELQDMDVDQRVAAIADAVRNAGLSSQETARHLQQLGFTQAQANDFFRQGGDAIREARTAVDAYGLSMSAVDAAQVEAANDAWARTSLIIEGVQNKMAVEFAPILQFVSDLINDAATEGDGFGSAIERGFEKGVRAAAFVVDAVEGVRRVFVLAGQGVATFALVSIQNLMRVTEFILSGPTDALNGLIRLMNSLPGVSIEMLQPLDIVTQLRAEILVAEAAVNEGVAAMNATLSAPMPSVGLLEAFDKSKAASRAAAEQITADRERERKAFAGTAAAAKDNSDAIAALSAAYNTLRRRLDPVTAATEDYLADVELLNRAWEEGLISGDEYELLMFSLATGMDDVADSAQRAAREADPFAEAWKNALRRIDDAFAAAWRGAFDSFTSFRRSITDAFKNMLAELAHAAITRPIMISIGMAGGIIPGAAHAGGAFQGGGSLLNMISGGYSGLLSSVGGIANSIGGALGSGIVSGIGGGMSVAAANIGAAGYFGSMGANLALAGQSFATGAIGTGIGAGLAALGPIAAGVALLSSLWGGRKTTGAGIQLGVTDGQLDAAEFVTSRRSGLSRAVRGSGRRTSISDIDPQTGAAIASMFDATMAAVSDAARALGADAADVVSGAVINAVQIDLRGKSEAEIQSAITEWLGSVADAMIGQLFEGVSGQRAFELAQYLTGINDALATLNVTALDASLRGAEAAEAIALAAGGFERLQGAHSAYYHAFLSDSERYHHTLGRITKTLNDAGLSMPRTNSELRALVEAQDLMTESGRAAYVALMGVADALNSLQQSAQRMQFTALGNLRTAVDAEQARLRASAEQQMGLVRAETDARIDANRIALDAAREGMRMIQGEFRTIQRARQRLLGEYAPADAGVRADAIARLQNAIATGDMAGAGNAAEIAARISEADYTSSSQFQAEQARTLYLLTQTEQLAGEQVDHAEAAVMRLDRVITTLRQSASSQIAQMQSDLEAQIAALDELYRVENEQLNALWGIKDGIMSVIDALGSLRSITQQQSGASVGATGRWSSQNGFDVWQSTGGATAVKTTSTDPLDAMIYAANDTQFTVRDAVNWVNDALAANDPRSVYDAALMTGIDAQSLDAMMGWEPGTSNLWASNEGLPTFANGGTHMGGLRIVGERGPELEATGPARYMNNSQLMSALGGGGDIEKMRQDLMAGLRAIEKNTREIKQIEQRWDRIGLPEQREFA